MTGPSPAQLERVLDAYRQRLLRSPWDLASRLQIARALRLLGRVDEAVHEYQMLAHQLLEEGDTWGAVSACTSILELAPDHPEIVRLLDFLLGLSTPEPASPEGSPSVALPPARLDDPVLLTRPLAGPADRQPPVPLEDILLHSADLLEEEGAAPPQAPAVAPAPAPVPASAHATLELGRTSRKPELVAVPAQLPPPLPPSSSSAPELPISLTELPPRWQHIAEQLAQHSAEQLERLVTEPSLPPVPVPRGLQGSLVDRPAEPAAIPLLRLLDTATLLGLLRGARRLLVQPGEEALSEGQPGESLFLVLQGKFQTTRNLAGRPPLDLGLLGRGSFFGETGLLLGLPATVNVVALEPAELLVFDRQLLRPALDAFPRFHKVLDSTRVRRQISALVGGAALFRDLPLAVREEVATVLRPLSLAAGATVVSPGQADPPLVLVLTGEVEELRPGTDPQAPALLARRHAGDVAGLPDAASGQPAALLLRTGVASELLLLGGALLRNLIDRHEAVAQAARQLLQLRRFVAAHGGGPC